MAPLTMPPGSTLQLKRRCPFEEEEEGRSEPREGTGEGFGHGVFHFPLPCFLSVLCCARRAMACSSDEAGAEEESGASWFLYVGICLSIAASIASVRGCSDRCAPPTRLTHPHTARQNLGVNIQKFSFIQEGKKHMDKRRPYVKQPLWWAGLGLVIFGAIGDFVAFAFAPASVVTPIGSLSAFPVRFQFLPAVLPMTSVSASPPSQLWSATFSLPTAGSKSRSLARTSSVQP